MRRTNTFLLLLLIGWISFACKTSKSTGWNYYDTKWRGDVSVVDKGAPKEVKKYMSGMLYIPGGTFTMGSSDDLLFTEKDSTLLPRTTLRRVTVSDFYLSDHEVTNGEYREFVKWVRDSVAMTMLAQKDPSWYKNKERRTLNWDRRAEIWSRDSAQFASLLEGKNKANNKIRTEKLIYTWVTDTSVTHIHVYPDTQALIQYSPYLLRNEGTRYYFSHPAFNDFPVVGVTWQQAMAYCHWLTWQVEQAYPPSPPDTKRIGENATAEFRLPTEAEWEYAAFSVLANSKFENVYDRRIYPWDGTAITDEKNSYLCNFGDIVDENGVRVKHSYDDGALMPAKVKSYPPNDFKLYDMAGNVAEWTMYRPELDTTDLLFEYGYPGNDGDMTYCFGRPLITEKSKEEGRFMDSIHKSTRILPTDNINEAYEKIKQRNHAYARYAYRNNNLRLGHWKKELYSKVNQAITDSLAIYLDHMDSVCRHGLKKTALRELQAVEVAYMNPNPRTVKGGSWADGLAYIMCGNKEAYSEDRSSCRIGFRVAMSREFRRVKQ